MSLLQFRAWNKKTQSFIDYGDLVLDLRSGKIYAGDIGLAESTFDVTDQIELMQSTGLKDKNGVEIFEGDIVQWGDTPDWEEKPIRVAVVKINPDIQFDSNVGIFEYGRFIYRDTERFLTVLGNVYENSELLEEQ
ncbi:YopX family protein [Enterococcus lactis]|uniref:YopX family protein n=1 Tax=Enterococcus lactis TaxID=357441 RepID=UPI00237A0FB6|nr:YopX family protein [Enterococcus lactis]